MKYRAEVDSPDWPWGARQVQDFDTLEERDSFVFGKVKLNGGSFTVKAWAGHDGREFYHVERANGVIHTINCSTVK